MEPVSGPCGGSSRALCSQTSEDHPAEVYCVFNDETNACENVFNNYCNQWLNTQRCDPANSVVQSVSAVADWSALRPPAGCTSVRYEIAGHSAPEMCPGFFSSLESQLGRLGVGCSQITVDSLGCSLFRNPSEVTNLAQTLCTQLHPGQTCTVSGNQCSGVLDPACNQEQDGTPTRLSVCIEGGVITNYQPCYNSGSICNGAWQSGQGWNCRLPDNTIARQTCCVPNYSFSGPRGDATWVPGDRCPVSCNSPGGTCPSPGANVACEGRQQTCCGYANRNTIVDGVNCPACGTYDATLSCSHSCTFTRRDDGYTHTASYTNQNDPVVTGQASCQAGPTSLQDSPFCSSDPILRIENCTASTCRVQETITCRITTCTPNECRRPSPSPTPRR